MGRISATFQVSSDGAATYTVPIWAPKGPNNLEPSIALTYNSQGSGLNAPYAGVGWSLSGLSVVSRCNKTVAQDGTASQVQLQTSDGYCLDGQRLRLVSGTYGAAGSTYRTEIASFLQATAEGSAGNGPSYWEVQGKDGLTYEYGNGGNAQETNGGTTPDEWWLDKVTDRSGNTMSVTYTTLYGGDAVVPHTISWTPSSHGSTQYDYTMTFGYEGDTTSVSHYGYVAGHQVIISSLLTSISINYNSSLVREYFLKYQQSTATSQQLLTEITECADSAQTNCLQPTTFTYQDSTPGISSSLDTALSSKATELKTHNDFNGDGYTDLAYCNGGSPDVIYVAFGSANGYGSPIDTGISCTSPQYGDLTGDGKDGILAPNGADWWYYTWNGSSFTGQNTGLAYDSTAAQFALADVNGDGLPDLITVHNTKSTLRSGATFYNIGVDVRINESTHEAASFSTSQATWYATSSNVPIEGIVVSNTDFPYGTNQFGTLNGFDFNGDGRQDIALQIVGTSSDSYYELISGSSSFTAKLVGSFAATGIGSMAFLNFNSDACTDYLVNDTIYLSGCDGTIPKAIPLPSGTNVIGTLDWNEDGRTDILVQNGSTVGVYLSDGNSISSLISTSIPYSSSNLYFGFKPDGTGLTALGVWNGTGTVDYHPHYTVSPPPVDALSTVTDGYGNSVKLKYVSLAIGSVGTYTPASSAPAGYKLYTGSMYVVAQATFSDPSNPPNGTYTRTYSYSGALESLTGRGFAGFATYTVLDSRNGLSETQTFNQVFPYTGLITADTVKNTATGDLVSSASYTLADTELSSTQFEERWFPHVSASTVKNYEVGGSENGALTQTTTANLSYDSYGNLTSSTQTTTDNDSGSPYYGYSWTTAVSNTPDVDTSTWCLPLVTQTTVTYSDTYDNSSITRTRQLTPDLTNCRYTQMVTAPGSAYQVTDALGYDSFGNIDSETVTGTGMAARVTTTNWGTTGQFPMSITDPTGATTSFNYDFGCGTVSSMTNPNGDATSWQYGDGFCRVTQETKPDGTYTTWSYSLYSGSDPKPRVVVTEESHETGGSIIRTTTEDFDMLDRPYLETTNLLDGSTATVMQKTYNSLGLVISEQEPYQGNTVGAVSYSYDALNRVTQMQRPTSASDSTPAVTTYQYAGDTTTITDPNGDTRTLVYDPNGWLRRSEDDLGYQVIFGYDAAGSRTSVTDNQGNTLWTGTWAYGIAPFLIGETAMDSGAWGFTIDPLGERIAWTDPKGQQFFETYDALSRPLTRSEPDLFTQWSWGSSASVHNIGHLAAVCTGMGTNPTACTSSGESEAWTYDAYGRLSTRSITLPSMGPFTYTWQYSPTTGLLQDLTYPLGASGQALSLQYTYAYGYLQSIADTLDSPNIVVWKADSMDPAGQVTQDTLGNGIITTRAFDAVTHFLTSVQSGVGGGAAVQNMSFLYDGVGNVTQRQNNNLGLTENFYYDGDNRLSYSTLNGTKNLSMTYDAMGNITARSDIANGAAWTYDSVHKHQVTEAGSTAYEYTYDANGNMTSAAGRTIGWTSYNYPSVISDSALGESINFQYGPNRNPWLETTDDSAGTTYTYRIGKLMDIVVNATGSIDRDYIYAGNQPVAVDERTESANDFYYFQTDQQDSVAAITNSSGKVAVDESFTAYGARRNPSTWSGPPSSSDLTTISGITQHGYTFQRSLGEVMDLNDMVGRVEDATIGRFISADPTMPNPYDPQDFNPYSYTENNPLTYIDPTGFCSYGKGGKDKSPPCPENSQPSGPGQSSGSISTYCSTTPCLPTDNIIAGPLPLPPQPQPLPPPQSPLQTISCIACSNLVSNGALNAIAGSLTAAIGKPQEKPKTTQPINCGSSEGIPASEVLTPASPSTEILTSGSNTFNVTAYGSQLQVAVTNLSIVPAIAVTDVSFQLDQVPPIGLGERGAVIGTGLTSIFRSEPYGVLGGRPLDVNVTVDVKNDGAVVSAQVCGIGAGGGH